MVTRILPPLFRAKARAEGPCGNRALRQAFLSLEYSIRNAPATVLDHVLGISDIPIY